MRGCRWGSRSTSARACGFLFVDQLVDIDAQPLPILLGPALGAVDPAPRVLCILQAIGPFRGRRTRLVKGCPRPSIGRRAVLTESVRRSAGMLVADAWSR